MKHIFREYDIRGVFGEDLDEETVKKIGYLLGRRIGEKGRYAVVSYDARTHSPRLFDWLVYGLNAAGITVLDGGMAPTPVNYFCNYRTFGIDGGEVTPAGGVQITGSHNPPEYNGFKITIDRTPFFGEDIYALGREIDDIRLPETVEKAVVPIDAKSLYIDYMTEHFSHLKGLRRRIVYDCGNGVAGTVLPEIFSRLGLEAEGIYVEPDGTFPNHHPDPSVEANLADLKTLMKESGADLGFAYDGDADRIAVLTPRHNIKGDQMAILFALTMDCPTVIGEVKCSQVMYDELRRRGATPVMYKTGHSNLKVKIRELDADLACEVSGHIFFADRYYGFDDAIYATFRILELLERGIDLDAELEALPQVYSTEEIKVETTEEEKFRLVERFKSLLERPPADFPEIRGINDIDGVRIDFEKGWALVRASNTTPVLVTRFEAADPETAGEYERKVNALLREAKRSLI